MHLRSKFESTLEAIKKNEEIFTDKIKGGSENPLDYHYMSYFSGLENGFKFVWMMLDGEVPEDEFDAQLDKLLQTSEASND